MDQYGGDFITITDEDGKEYELEVLLAFDLDDEQYMALIPAGSGSDDSAEDLEVSILKVVVEDGEELLDAIEDDDELERAYARMMELIYEADADASDK